MKSSLAVGQRVEVTVGPIAHGGHCVARHDGQVIFVRHALPNERAVVHITSVGAKFARGDALEILQASPDRVVAPCKYAGECGGCDFQHVSLAAQRELKSAVISEQFRRLAKMDVRVDVEAVPNPFDLEGSGLHWRTRVAFVASRAGRLGLRRNHSHDLVLIDDCLIAVPAIAGSKATERTWPAGSTVQVVASNTGEESIVVSSEDGNVEILGSAKVHQQVRGRTFEISADGFWQVHPGAPELLSSAVIDGLAPRPGEHALDLYAGAGLFTSALLSGVGSGGHVDLVESSSVGIHDAKGIFGQSPNVSIHQGDVLRVLREMSARTQGLHTDLVVLDPPRAGAGALVLTAVAAAKPRRIAYVACDPAALARDTAYLHELGYPLEQVRAFDLFPMTHHIECVAVYAPLLEER